MGDVIKFEPWTVGEGYRYDPDDVLESAKGNEFGRMVIIGELPDGTLSVTGTANAGESLILLHQAINYIVEPD